ncbi:MAG: hypothetical protein Q8898_05950 [Bacillota bacterium]|nr:hypothetical protein [Bacillota bacterium]
MNKESMLQLIHSMITSSTKNPKYAVLSTAKIANILDCPIGEVESGITEFVQTGKLQKSTLQDSPNYDIYLLP